MWEVIELAADMASFNNASIEGTLRAIQAGLVGQSQLRQYAVLLSESRVAQEPMAARDEDDPGLHTPKVLARYHHSPRHRRQQGDSRAPRTRSRTRSGRCGRLAPTDILVGQALAPT